jgi:hypothetical protein
MDLTNFWFNLTCPPEPSANASVEQRIQVNRARQASTLLFWLILVAIFAIPTALLKNNQPLLIILAITVAFYIVAIVANRAGRLKTAGIITMVFLEGGFVLALLGLQATGGPQISDLPTFMLLVESCIASAAFFTPGWTIALTVTNCVIIFVYLMALPKAQDLAALMHTTSAYDVVSRPILLVIVVGFTLTSFSMGWLRELRRADHAEVIIDIDRRELASKDEELVMKRQLEDEMQQILMALNTFANGDLNARTPIKQNNLLFRVGYSVNNLLSRVQSSYAERAQQEKTLRAIKLLSAAIEQRVPLHQLGWTGTPIDDIIRAYRNVSVEREKQPRQINNTYSPLTIDNASNTSLEREKQPRPTNNTHALLSAEHASLEKEKQPRANNTYPPLTVEQVSPRPSVNTPRHPKSST